MPLVHRHNHVRRAAPAPMFREQRIRKYALVGKAEKVRAKIPPVLRSNYDQGGEVPFFSVWRAVFLEYISTTCFVFYACGSVLAANYYGLQTAASVVLASITQGFAIATLVYATSHTSGGHINPAVTFALMVSGHMGIIRGLFYIVVQLLGGITGAALLDAVTPGPSGTLGTTTPTEAGSRFQAVLIEWIITFTLIFTIFGTAINKAGSASGTHSLAPLPIGFAVLIGVMTAYNISGGSMNPARTFGPAVVSGTWDNHWIYWIGPLGAALCVGLLERYVLLVIPAPVQPAVVEESRAIAESVVADAIAATAATGTNPDSAEGQKAQEAYIAERTEEIAAAEASATRGSFLEKQYPSAAARRMSIMPMNRRMSVMPTAALDIEEGLKRSQTMAPPGSTAAVAEAQASAQAAVAAAVAAVAEATVQQQQQQQNVAAEAQAQHQQAAIEMLTGTGEPGDSGF